MHLLEFHLDLPLSMCCGVDLLIQRKDLFAIHRLHIGVVFVCHIFELIEIIHHGLVLFMSDFQPLHVRKAVLVILEYEFLMFFCLCI